ncbi:superoxide dismutase family protein [Paeniclostridium sordellii]|uniref:superoxide dismutase family protein n=1 Tax=Paraclostridium sordellii TaxID=1505 RepID=UPI00135FE7C9|nr:superoxide dismutase family protein [Paeniclostridium sordellii]MRZ78876.1 superoxide dismutase family protein [Paeniclostridium sordellii]MSB59865.1 superoxide dismutase family protein [Paeniclostridium sordellii]
MDNSCKKYDINKMFSNYSPSKPDAYAKIKGGPLAPCINGIVYLYQLEEGVYLKAYITGIPNINNQTSSFHGFHIHEVGDCTVGNESDPFTAAKSHYNPTNEEHPMHAGDLPPILSADGIGILSTFTNRFVINEVIGKSFILHKGYDDFTTQPAGNAGSRLACGVINAYSR